jgi:hypothetical protein
LQRLDQLVALREPLKKPPNRRRSRHRKIINPVDAKIKLTRRERGPDQLLFLHGKRQALPCKYCNEDAPIAGCTAQPRNTAIISGTVATLSIFDYGQSCL